MHDAAINIVQRKQHTGLYLLKNIYFMFWWLHILERDMP